MSNVKPFPHIPVLLNEALEALNPQPGETFFDLTVGAGGHCRAVTERLGVQGRAHAFDLDEAALAAARRTLRDAPCPIEFHHLPFDEVPEMINAGDMPPADIIIADLGVSSMMIDDPARGFSFRLDGPLDMRMDVSGGPSAAEFVASLPEDELADVIYRYGEERWSRRIARKITEARREAPVVSTGRLAELVAAAVPGRFRSKRIHPATRTFQALRILVNDEIGRLERLLSGIDEILAPGGRFAVITFHSLEDRPVKIRFKELAATSRYSLWRKKPVSAGESEIRANPRARSAKLRAVTRIA